MKKKTFLVKETSLPKGELNGTWSIHSNTSPDAKCDHLIIAQTATSATLLLSGNEEARCADELTLMRSISQGGKKSETSMVIKVVPTPGRVTSFVEMKGNPQPAIQTCPSWDCLNHTDPSLGELPSGELAIWFAAGGDRSKGKPVVGRAVQKKNSGWVLDKDPVMTDADATTENWDKARETPSVKWNESAKAWDMWYLGYKTGYHVDPAIGQARSLDAQGTQWKRTKQPIYRPSQGAWDETFLTSPGALRGSDGTWRLYFAGASTKKDAITRIGVLLSKDGTTWTPYKNNPVFQGEPEKWDYNILDPHVQFVGGRYVMWYSALAGQYQSNPPISVGVAVSEDGFTWKRLLDKPLITPKENSWTSSSVLDVEVLPRADGTLLMVGYANSKKAPNPQFPAFRPGRLGFWISKEIK